MPALSVLLGIGSAIAGLIGAGAKVRANKKAANLAVKNIERQESQDKKIFEQQEKQREEDLKARKKAAFQRAMGFDSVVSPKYVPGIPPLQTLTDPAIVRASNVGDIFGGISSALGTAAMSKFAENPRAYFPASGRRVIPGITTVYDRNKMVPYS
jgi:hypothetical protein